MVGSHDHHMTGSRSQRRQEKVSGESEALRRAAPGSEWRDGGRGGEEEEEEGETGREAGAIPG